jgi:hypothetical protein
VVSTGAEVGAKCGWKIVRTDGTMHRFPFFPGRNPVRWKRLESSRMVRKLLSPAAYTYFVMAEKNVGGRNAD